MYIQCRRRQCGERPPPTLVPSSWRVYRLEMYIFRAKGLSIFRSVRRLAKRRPCICMYKVWYIGCVMGSRSRVVKDRRIREDQSATAEDVGMVKFYWRGKERELMD